MARQELYDRIVNACFFRECSKPRPMRPDHLRLLKSHNPELAEYLVKVLTD